MDYFNEAERESQQAFSRWRDSKLAPLLNAMQRTGLTPNRITLISIALLVAGCLLPPSYFLLPPLLLFFYCVLDGFDGPLARHMGLAHEGGAGVDIYATMAVIEEIAKRSVALAKSTFSKDNLANSASNCSLPKTICLPRSCCLKKCWTFARARGV